MARILTEAEAFFTQCVRDYIEQDETIQARLCHTIEGMIQQGQTRPTVDMDTSFKRYIEQKQGDSLNRLLAENREESLARVFIQYGFSQVDWAGILNDYWAQVQQERDVLPKQEGQEE